MHRRLPLPVLLLVLLLGAAPSTLMAAKPDHWVGTWAAAPLGSPNDEIMAGAADETLRQIVHVSLGGSRVRVVLTNEFGTDALTIGAAQAALRSTGSEIVLPTTNALTFNGQPTVVIPPGALAVSDPISLNLPAFADLAISVFLPAQQIQQITQHGGAFQTNYVAAGNQVSTKTLDGASEISSWRFIKSVEVLASEDSGAIVALGDSITDGAASTRNSNSRWPDVLARRLAANKKTARLAVLNEGIGGNRLLHDITGQNALARFDRDVLGNVGVRYLVVMLGINDIGRTTVPLHPGDEVTTAQLLFALQQIIDRAHAHGIKVIGATLTPYVGAAYASPEGEAMRQAENAFIRGGKFDGFVDFEKATQDPANPAVMLPVNDSGDHLHPRDAGYKAMGESIDLKLFEK